MPPAGVIRLNAVTDMELVPLVMAAGLDTLICIGRVGKPWVMMQRPLVKGALPVDRQPVVLRPPFVDIVTEFAAPHVIMSPKLRGCGQFIACAKAGVAARFIKVTAESCTIVLPIAFPFCRVLSVDLADISMRQAFGFQVFTNNFRSGLFANNIYAK